VSAPAGFIAFADATGLAALGSFGDGCRAVVVDPARTDPGQVAALLGRDRPVLCHPDRPGRESCERAIRALAPALGLVFSYNRILWPELLAAFPHGVANLHNGRLPDYRGANVLQWAIINGETETAATLHYLDQGIDTGPIIEARAVAISDDDTALSLRDRLLVADRQLLERWLPRLLAGPVPATPQPVAGGQSWPRRRPEDGLIDWSWSDERIRNLIRALAAPWPGARYRDRDGRTVILDRPLSLGEIRDLRRSLP
jgi:methionyl-tRNA formyltransferase